MDMEKMKKMNEMAAELKKHKNLFPDEDLAQKAEEIIMDDNPLRMEEKEPSQANETELLVQEANKATRTELDMIRKGLLQLNEEFKEFKRDTIEKLEKVKQMALATPPQLPDPPKVEIAAEITTEASEDPKPAEVKTEEKSEKGFSPEDVAVDKVFYFGKK